MVEQPHFDDEVTALTARPVVPLQKIDAKIKHRRRWFLGGAFAVAMLLGAASALVSAYLKLRNVPDPEIQALSVLPLDPPIPTVEVISERPKPKLRNTDRTDKRVTDIPVVQPRLNEEDELRRIRDAVLIDQWQERRERRVQRRERRRAQHRDRNLSNLDEIFEGPRRP